MKLTEQQVQKYVEGGGVACPFCGSYDLHPMGITTSEDGTMKQMVVCGCCGANWYDISHLVGVEYENEAGENTEIIPKDTLVLFLGEDIDEGLVVLETNKELHPDHVVDWDWLDSGVCPICHNELNEKDQCEGCNADWSAEIGADEVLEIIRKKETQSND